LTIIDIGLPKAESGKEKRFDEVHFEEERLLIERILKDYCSERGKTVCSERVVAIA
jgi:hypothetical protein